jgi:hypothetical protein
MAQGVLEVVTEKLPLSPPPPHGTFAELPPGALPGDIPGALRGVVFSGGVRNVLPDGFYDAVPYPVQISIFAEGGLRCWDEVGTIEYLNPDGAPLVAPILRMYAVECVGSVAGENPTYQCFQFLEDHLSENSTGELTPQFNFAAFTLSIQGDGSVYFAYHQGTYTNAIGYLRGEGVQKAAGLRTDEHKHEVSEHLSAVQQLCTEPVVRACYDAYYDDGLCDDLQLRECLRDYDFAALDNNVVMCQDLARCRQINLPGMNNTGSDFGRLPPADIRGRARVTMPSPPHDWGVFALGEDFFVRQIPVAPLGCSCTSDQGPPSCEGLLDPVTLEPVCMQSSFGDAAELQGLVMLVTSTICYPWARGPNPTGQCFAGLNRIIMKDGLSRPAYNLRTISDPTAGKYEQLYAVYSLQVDGTIYWAAPLGNIMVAEGILEKAGSTGSPDSGGGGADLNTVAIVGVALGCVVGVALGVAAMGRRNSPREQDGKEDPLL